MFNLNTLVMLILVVLTGCGLTSRVSVEHHWGYMGPDTWEAKGKGVSVFSSRSSCWEAEQMLTNLAHDANAGKFDWAEMANEPFRTNKLHEECERIKSK